ncbi:alpha-galactosidase [Aestuariimicrobium sp. T2.26MG-19.2B]|uniref:alpha-galactosidase n=1 Tax=Aestuariimicrobium sp. T2.26MG-19.2B TaxID=3040679 RepID=UPI00247771C3|nr:alpha-galactosidase [Aestuariimicrobium sp. T2.26MG-19.2B]CAI9411179.1 Alpha-galactosidase [Aestuariimicrobium sp. T2.26MG-19.2B]
MATDVHAQPSALPTHRILLTSEKSVVALKISRGDLPAVLHWGDPLGDLSVDQFEAMDSVLGGSGMNNGVPADFHRTALVPETWMGWTGRPGLSGSRSGKDWAPKFVVNQVLLDGSEADPDAVATGHVLQVRAGCASTRLELAIEVEIDDAGLVRVRATVTNGGDDGYQVGELNVALPVPYRASEVLDTAGRWGKERVPQRTTLGVGAHVREGRHGRTGADAATIVHLGEPGFGFAEGEVWGVHVGWSGNHLHYAERVLTGEQLVGGGEILLPGEMVLANGQSYAGPWVYFSHGHGLDAIAHQNHAFLRRVHPVGTDRPVTINVWEAVYFDHDADRLIDLAERAAAVGVERYVLDDGWFGSRRDDHSGLGDWVVSQDVWPQGLHPLIDKVRELGMQFGLWFEPEMVNPDSDLARAHPEWVMQVPGRMPLESRNQWVLNLAVPEAYAHVRDQMMALLNEYEIGYIKWDHNRDLLDAGTAPDGRPAVHEQTLAFYRLVDELKAAHQGLEIESCSSGGARIDLEVMQHCDRVWVSDNIDPTDRQQMLRWTTQLLPPELMGSHIASGASHTTGRHHDINYRAATAVFGHLGIEWDLKQATDDEVAALKAWVQWYKDNRAHLLGGTLVRLDTQPGVFVHGVVTADRGIFSITQLEMSTTWTIGAIRLPGLDPDASYRVSELELTQVRGAVVSPTVLTGRQLATHGILTGVGVPERARIVIAERV